MKYTSICFPCTLHRSSQRCSRCHGIRDSPLTRSVNVVLHHLLYFHKIELVFSIYVSLHVNHFDESISCFLLPWNLQLVYRHRRSASTDEGKDSYDIINRLPADAEWLTAKPCKTSNTSEISVHRNNKIKRNVLKMPSLYTLHIVDSWGNSSSRTSKTSLHSSNLKRRTVRSS